MNKLIKKEYNLPSKLEDLTRFVLVGREKLVSVRAEIRAIDKLDLATEVKDQKRDEATMLAGALLDAEAKIGELLPEPKSIRNDLGQLEHTCFDDGKVFFDNNEILEIDLIKSLSL